MVEITSAEDLAVYCIVCHLQQDETGQMRMSVLGGVLTSLFCRAPHLEYGKLKALVKAHPDKLDYTQTTQSVSLRTGSRSSMTRFNLSTLHAPFQEPECLDIFFKEIK